MSVKIRMPLLVIALASCAPATTTAPEGEPAIPGSTATITMQESTMVEPRDVTPLAEPTQPCGYQWAHQALPVVSVQFQQAFDEAGLTGVTVRADAFGENCPTRTAACNIFLPGKRTYISRSRVRIFLPETLGGWLEQILTVIGQIPAENLPGPMSASASLGFEFTAGAGTKILWLERPQVFAALEDGKRGAELYQALVP